VRAKGTIIFIARAVDVRRAGMKQLDEGAVLLELEKGHASWIIRRRTRAFPD
jgi:hypothetical protein